MLGQLTERTIAAVKRFLPRGGSLPYEEWERRHHVIVVLLWVHALGLTIFGHGRILAVEEALFLPLLAGLISEGVAAGVFDTFDPEGVADMIYGLAARTNSSILQVLQAADEPAREHAIDSLARRFRLHGLAIDRILGLPDGSITALTRAQVEALVAALPRSY